MELYSILFNDLYGKGISKKRVSIYMYTTDSLGCTPETNITLQINSTSIKKILIEITIMSTSKEGSWFRSH